tara:strand:- start:2872 stop:3099 length:228 start_codon:yes stop_codon:yes gene_type:complete
MKFKEYVENLNKLLKEKPETAELEVITSIDDEGNAFNRVFYGPATGVYDEGDNTFYDEDDFLEDAEIKVNAVCLN